MEQNNGQPEEKVKREKTKKFPKMSPVKIVILLIMLVGTVCSYVLHDYIFPADSIFNRGIASSEFLNGLLALVPNIIQAIRIITVILVITTIVLAILNKAFRKNQRQITVVRLINSMVKCVMTIVLVIDRKSTRLNSSH